MKLLSQNALIMSNGFFKSVCGDLKLLHLVWEPATSVVGGLGVAVAGLCDALSAVDGVSVDMIFPSIDKDLAGQSSFTMNSYALKIDANEALRLRESVLAEAELGASLADIDSEVVSFTKKVSAQMLQCQKNYSVVHAHDWMTAAAGVWVKRSMKVPMILHIHSTHMDREGAHAMGAVYEHEKWAMQQADIIIAVSAFTKALIIKRYGISEDKVRVILNAGGTALQHDEVEMIQKDSAPMVLFAGRLEPQKSPIFALEIMINTLRRMKDARGVIAGGGDMLEPIRKIVKFKKMEHRIEVLGRIPQSHIRAVYQSASVIVMPSLSEPFGLVAIEAAREGVAVMLSDRCGASELMSSAVVNTLFDMEAWTDGVIELLENPHLCELQVKKQLDDVGSYSWKDVSVKVLDLVTEITTF